MSSLSLTPDMLQAMSTELAVVVQRYSQCSDINLVLSGSETCTTDQESQCVVGKDTQDKERILVKVSLSAP